jgi:uncharacterized protein (TIGR00369 family)
VAQPLADRIQASFDRQSLMRTFEASIESIAPGSVAIRSPISHGARQQQGFAHAGLTFALGDTAAGYSALTLLPEESEVLTAEIKINLLAPGAGDHLVARGRVLKPGRRLIVVASDVFAVAADGTEVHIAALQGTMVSTRL